VSISLSVDPALAVTPAIRARLRRELARMVTAAARHDGRKGYEVALRICDDAAIRELNRDYRNKDKPTDVLAFAQREAAAAAADLLGDIVISLETAKRQAKRGLYAELLHLASHGLCHLLGYDHRDDEEERVMNERAAALRREAARSGKVRAA
jgi:probable rRNA maturation factor